MISNEELQKTLTEQGIEDSMLGLLSHTLKEILQTEIKKFCEEEASSEPLALFAEFLGEKPFTTEHAAEVLASSRCACAVADIDAYVALYKTDIANALR